MKIAPVLRALARLENTTAQLVHTGQHFSDSMSLIFHDDLDLPEPDIQLRVKTGSPAERIAGILVACDRIFSEARPDVVIVVGDVDSTLAAAIAAAKQGVPLMHVEAGLRSFDRSMPEEINRIIIDSVADHLFTTSLEASQNLQREGVASEKIHLVGNVMIDSLCAHRERARFLKTPARFGLENEGYALVTLHRPSNVDDPGVLSSLVDALVTIQKRVPLVFPVHPRTRNRLEDLGLMERLAESSYLRVLEPLGYLQFLDLMMHARLVLTDSGGIQEETTFLGVPCLTLRANTERPETIEQGTNELVGTDPDRIISATVKVLSGEFKTGAIPDLWDGHAAERIVEIMARIYG
jgi:UDP-N-acetylglucosamine 2-epimerase (non-hydrolysing)